MADKIEAVMLSQLFPFPDNPFKVNEGIEMDMLIESIKEFGIITPLIVRPVEDGYEIVSGHRRYEAYRVFITDLSPE